MISHAVFRNEPGDLICRVAVRINKKPAVALADVFDEKIYEEGGFADATHTLHIYVFGGVD
jgi:hypothetical protein